MKARHSFMAGSFFHCGSLGSFRYAALRMSWPFSYPAGFMTLPTDTDTLVRKWTGCQLNSPIFLIAWAANFGVAMLTKMSGLAPLICTTCESTVGEVVSYELSTTISLLA